MKRALILALPLLLAASCEHLGMNGSHGDVAMQALRKLCSAPPEQLATLFPDPAHQRALAMACSVINMSPRI